MIKLLTNGYDRHAIPAASARIVNTRNILARRFNQVTFHYEMAAPSKGRSHPMQLSVVR